MSGRIKDSVIFGLLDSHVLKWLLLNSSQKGKAVQKRSI